MAINYQQLLDEAMLGIVKHILTKLQDRTIDDEQCFYISFRTDHPEVILSKSVKIRYPQEITIVLQYQYKELRVLADRFSVNIAFGGVPETIEVPFDSLVSFVDPAANFSLQFKQEKEITIEDKKQQNKQPSPPVSQKKESGKIIAIDKFRNKNKQ